MTAHDPTAEERPERGEGDSASQVDADDYVFVEASHAPSEETDMVPAPGGDARRTSVVAESDLSWWGDDGPIDSPPEPAVVPVESRPEPPDSAPPRRGRDVYDRAESRPSRAGLVATAPTGPSRELSRSRRTPSQVQADPMTINELARDAARRRAAAVAKTDGGASRRMYMDQQRAHHFELEERHYPRMLALLEDSDSVPLGHAPIPKSQLPAVPGTFFPKGKTRRAHPDDAPDVDAMLGAMAEGLFVGGTSASSEVLITLTDEFFRGTELRVSIEDGAIAAHLTPPDYETYWQLTGEIHRLRDRFEERGMKVATLHVHEP